MSQTLNPPRSDPRSRLDADAVRAAYRRWAGVYDAVFGGVSALARRCTVAAVNRLPGERVLEMGVGTGLALPQYAAGKRITGIDLSAEMLARAERRIERLGLGNVQGLFEMDAEATGFATASFDIAVAMFVASVVPNARSMLAEMRRVVRPGGWLLFVNHFAAKSGPRWWLEWAMAPASRALGWHPDFAMDTLLTAAEQRAAAIEAMPPAGLFTLVRLPNRVAEKPVELFSGTPNQPPGT